MLSLSVAQPTNPVVGDLRATGSQTFSFLEAALDEVPEVVLGTSPSWPVGMSAEEFARQMAGSIIWLKPESPASGEGRYAVVAPTVSQSDAVTLWMMPEGQFTWAAFDLNAIQWLPHLATVEGHQGSQPTVEVASPLGILRLTAAYEEGVALLSVSVGDAPAAQPKPVPAVLGMRLIAQAMVDKWRAWVPRYGAVAEVDIRGALAGVPRACEAIAILRRAEVLPAALSGAPGDWSQLPSSESEALLELAACLAGKRELLPRLRDAFRLTPGAVAHSSAVDVLVATTNLVWLIHCHADAFDSMCEDWAEVYGSSSSAFAALLKKLADTLPTGAQPVAGPAPLAGGPLLANAAPVAGAAAALPATRPPGAPPSFHTPAAVRGGSPLKPGYLSGWPASRSASPALGSRSSPLSFAAAGPRGAVSGASVRVLPIYPPPPLAPGPGGVAPAPAVVASPVPPVPPVPPVLPVPPVPLVPPMPPIPPPAVAPVAAPILMTVFGYAGFVGSPADLVVALGGPSFIADLRAIALQAGSVRVQLASVPSAVNANSDISAALSFVDEVFDRTSADRPWTLDWPSIRGELATPPLGLPECGDRLVALTNMVSHAVVAGRAPPAHTLSTGMSAVELAARRVSRTIEMHMVADSSENAAWAASRPLLDVLTSDAAIDATFAADVAVAPDASAARAVRALVEMPVFGRHAEAAIFSSFKAP